MRALPTILSLAGIFSFTMPSFSQGDNCAGSFLVFPGAQTSDGPSSGGGASQGDATNADWFSFDPVLPGYITVTSCDDGAIDSRVHVHTGSCATLNTLASDDDGCPLGYPPGNSLVTNVPVTPGNLYFIEWDDRWSEDAFAWELIFHTCPVPVPPSFTSSDTSVTVDWDVLAPGATFNIEIGPTGFTPGTGTLITGITGTDGPPVTITGLTFATEYDVYITNDCSGDVSPSVGPWPVSTAGNPDVPNDDCFNAATIACGETVTDSTDLAFDDNVVDCFTAIQAPGVWYDLVGTGGVVLLTTCGGTDYDTRLNVYSGDCDALVCETGNDDGTFCGTASEVIFPTVAGEIYHVLVQGYDGATGTFSLTMDCPTCAPPQNTFVAPSDVEADVYWTSYNSGSDFTVEYGPTGFVPGTGTVMTGTVGVDGPPAHIAGLTAATDYDVYVSEDCGAGGSSVVLGPYGFTTLTDPPPANTFCANALPIACGGDVTGSTSGAVLSPAPTCGSANVNTPGLWYVFTGNGDDVTMSTCNQAAYDSKISVFTGGCAALSCVAGNDDGPACGTTSLVTFPTVIGTEYLVLVHGYDGSTGTFTLSMICAPPCAPAITNDECATATTIEPQDLGTCIPLQATNICAFGTPVPNPPCDPYANIVDVWFTFNSGDNTDHTLILTAGTAAVLNAALYEDCGELTYLGCGLDVSGAQPLTGLQVNTDYWVRIWNGGGPDAGTFSLCVETDLPNAITEDRSVPMRVFPVPTSDVLRVEGLPEGAKTLAITDLQGRVLLRDAIVGTTTIDVSALSPGTYVLQAEGIAIGANVVFVKE